MPQWQEELIDRLSNPLPITPVTDPLPVTETNPVIVIPVFRPANATHASVALNAATSVVVCPTNLNRRRIILHNDSGSVVFIKLGPVASTSAFSFRMAANETHHGVMGDYTGPISAIRASGTSNLQVTEIIT